MENPSMRSPFGEATILVTGGTGSFGHAFVDYILPMSFSELRILSRDELKQHEMRTNLNDPRIRFYIGDVRHRRSVDDAMRGVDYVFHAAALKQVPSCEFFPMQAVLTNIVGSANVVESAVAHGVRKLVCLSTDKAVYPINSMGMTKALMEKVSQAVARRLGQDRTVISCVRYGNVLCSRGSIVPLFVDQARAHAPMTVTYGGMTRFLLPLRDAIALVVFAFTEGRQGDLFVRKAPASTVLDLAKAVRSLMRSRSEIVEIGIRHGEKIYETLVSREEMARASDLGDYFRVPLDERDLNYSSYFTDGSREVQQHEDYTSHNTVRLSVVELERLLASLPEFRSDLAM